MVFPQNLTTPVLWPATSTLSPRRTSGPPHVELLADGVRLRLSGEEPAFDRYELRFKLSGIRREVSGWKQERLKSDLQEPVRFYQLKRRRPAAPLFLGSAGRGAFEALEADAALAEDEAEHSARAESPAKRTMRTATGRHL